MSRKHSSFSRRALWSAVGGAATVLFAADVHAAVEPQQKIVRYADLDLANPQDASELYARLERAAQAVCRTHAGSELSRKRMSLQCEAQALSDAVNAIDHSALKALHNSDSRIRVAQGAQSGS
jgi:UrcA family protein